MTTSSDPRRVCYICEREFDETDTLTMRCSHVYCKGCLRFRFESAISSTDLFPASCCGIEIRLQIKLRVARPLLSPKFVEMYQTPEFLRVYCHDKSCGSFISPHSIHNGRAYCQKRSQDYCNKVTCITCNEEAHFGPCSLSHWSHLSPRAATAALIAAKKWRACPRCGQLYEKLEGCDHMECDCEEGNNGGGVEFCYGCGVEYHDDNLRCICIYQY